MTCSEDMAHKNLRSPEIRRGEKDHNFINPFEVEVNEDLFCISSGARAQAEVAIDILNAEAVGKAAFKNLYSEEACCQNFQIPCTSSKAVLNGV